MYFYHLDVPVSSFSQAQPKRFSLYFKDWTFSAACHYLLALQVCTFNLNSSKA